MWELQQDQMREEDEGLPGAARDPQATADPLPPDSPELDPTRAVVSAGVRN
jgi:hypothetical protein